jgi:hypothetical protein
METETDPEEKKKKMIEVRRLQAVFRKEVKVSTSQRNTFNKNICKGLTIELMELRHTNSFQKCVEREQANLQQEMNQSFAKIRNTH